MKQLFIRQFYVVIIGSTLLLSGCFSGVSKPATFYMLSAQPILSTVSQVKTSVGVVPVEVPEFLDKPQIVLNETDTLMTISETNRWSEPLAQVTQRVLVEDLQRLLPNVYVQTKGYDDNKFNRLVQVEINTMTGNLDKEAMLSVWWTLKNGSGAVMTRKRFDKTIALKNDSYGDYVRAQSILWSDLAHEIAIQIAK